MFMSAIYHGCIFKPFSWHYISIVFMFFVCVSQGRNMKLRQQVLAITSGVCVYSTNVKKGQKLYCITANGERSATLSFFTFVKSLVCTSLGVCYISFVCRIIHSVEWLPLTRLNFAKVLELGYTKSIKKTSAH